MFSKLYDFIIRKHLEILTFIFVLISLGFLSQTESNVVLKVQNAWQDISVVLKRPVVERQRKQKIIEENSQLRMNIFKLNQEVSRLQNLDSENARLRSMLAFKDTSHYELLPTLIVYKGFKNENSVITIDKGHKDGVKANDVIVDKDGLVGKIISSSASTSLANMIIEPDVRVSVRINPSRVYGILKWHHGNTFIIEDIPSTIDIKPGWSVTTSGLSEVYPPDIPVGVISEVLISENGFTHHIEGNYNVTFNNLKEVFVLKNDRK
ncbi:MAG: rod shape-determining protein MreC [Candidatus Neomarinimicrobiota bacterium]